MGDASGKQFSSETVSLLMATLMKKDAKVSFDYKTMSALSNVSDSPLTPSAIEHQFRAVRKRAKEIVDDSAGKPELKPVAAPQEAVAASKKHGGSLPSHSSLTSENGSS